MIVWRGASYRVFTRHDGVLLCSDGGGADWLITGAFFKAVIASGELSLPGGKYRP